MIEFSSEQRIAAAKIHNILEPLKDKIRELYPEAKFDLNDLFQLNVYTDEPNLWPVMDIVDEELLDIADKKGLSIHVIPSRLEDQETPTN